MPISKTPRVYIIEKCETPQTITEVATAVPAFIGYTEKSVNENQLLLNKPWKINSMAEFHTHFGGAPKPHFSLEENTTENAIPFNGKGYLPVRKDRFSFYHNMLLFYANGGGVCYVVSVGNYTAGKIEKDKLEAGIEALIEEQEPTLLVIPEAVNLEIADDCYAVQKAMLQHCGGQMRNRIAIFDVYEGFKGSNETDDNAVKKFLDAIGNNCLDYCAAYYPWLNTSIVEKNELNFENLDIEQLKTLLYDELDISTMSNVKKEQVKAVIDQLATDLPVEESTSLHKALSNKSQLYREILKKMCNALNLLPASAAMAGIYSKVDNTKGVWKAPANVNLEKVVSQAVNFNHTDLNDLIVPIHGKSVNVIRSITGEGIMVWGARTMDGNSADNRYINVRRTMIMIEESVKNASKAFVFEINDANTWVNVKSMISNFLNGIWKRGGLVGASTNEAYNVRIGLGETMTPKDISEGIMRVSVLAALIRPGEFIEITFQFQMQKN